MIRSESARRAEELLETARTHEALTLANRCLKQGANGSEARLRAVRSVALWLAGDAGAASREVERARRVADAQGRSDVAVSLGATRALFRWREMDFEGAEAELALAESLASDSGAERIRRQSIRAGLLRDTGELSAAVLLLSQAIDDRASWAADWRGRLLADRAGVLASLGRWSEAREDAARSAAAFRQTADFREHTVAGLVRARIDVATADLEEARRGLERCQGLFRSERVDPRARADVQLLACDLELASGAARDAVKAAGEALALFRAAGDRRGSCLSHVRHSHALLASGRLGEALGEARRGVRAAGAHPTQLLAWAEFAVGRLQLRIQPRLAVSHFDRATTLAGERGDLVSVATLGACIAEGAGASEAARAQIDALTAGGDRRILAFALADLREHTARPVAAASPSEPIDLALVSARERALVDVALALAGSGPWEERFAAAVRAARPALEWRRVVLARPRGGLAVRADSPGSRALAGDDVALRLRAAGPTRIALGTGPWRDESVHVMLGVREALYAPLASGGALIFEVPGPGGPEDLALAVELARLVSPRLGEASVEPAENDEVEPERAFPEIVGRCPALGELFSKLERIAASEAFVHIAGETGTGKGKVALAIHRKSKRNRGRLVAVNAASLSDELFEAELFGHAKGAFTGAHVAREGYVAEAEGGTLFLDEVAELSPRSQAKLLRLLQEREYRRVGESETRRANIRVISAANADLEARVAEGRFREDLLFRLNVLSIRLPPLRDRGDDVLILARHFLRLAAGRDARPVPSLTPAVARALERYAWPGNVRELENEMARLVAMAAGEPLRPQQLSQKVQDGGADKAPATRLREALLHFERDVLRNALDRRGGNRLRTAEDLGITRQALLGKMERLGVR